MLPDVSMIIRSTMAESDTLVGGLRRIYIDAAVGAIGGEASHLKKIEAGSGKCDRRNPRALQRLARTTV